MVRLPFTNSSPAATAVAEPVVAEPEAVKGAEAEQEAPPAEPEPQRGGRGGGKGRSKYATKDLTEGSIPKNLWFLAWPQVIAGSMRTADQLADIFLAGMIDFRAVASVGIAQSWASLFNTGRSGMDTASRAMISRAMGAKNIPLANHVAAQSILINSIMSLTWIIPGVFLSEYLLRVLGVTDALIDQGLWYMRFRFAGSFPFMLTMITSSTLSAAGDTLTPMRAQVLNRVLNISMMPLFVFGVFWLPEMGIAGTGFAFMIAQIPGMLLNFWALFKGTSRLHLHLPDFKPDPRQMFRQVKLGVPASVTAGERSFAQMLVYGLVSPFGDIALAAYALMQRMEQIVNLGQQGLGQATGILVGQNLGAHKPERAQATVKWSMLMTIGLSLTVCALIMIYPRALLLIFTRDEELLVVGSHWLRIIAIGFVAGGLSTVFVQAINTAGDTIFPMIVTLGTIWLVQQPLAAYLSGQADALPLIGGILPFADSVDLNSYGVAWAMVIAQVVRLFFYYSYYLTGRWMHKEVL